MTKAYTNDQKAEFVKKFLEMQHAGKKIKDIEETLGISNSVVYGWIGKAKQESKKLGKKVAANGRQLKYSPELKEQALQMVAGGMRQVDVQRQLKLGNGMLNYWLKRKAREDGGVPAVIPAASKAANGIGSGGAITDALIYLRHAEKEILEMIREGKISRPDQAHLLTLLALGAVQKAIAK